MSSAFENPEYTHSAGLSDKASDTTSESGESDPTLSAVKAKADDLPRRRTKAALFALLFLLIVVGLTVGAILATNESDDDGKSKGSVASPEDVVKTITPTEEATTVPTEALTIAPTPEETPAATEGPTPGDIVANWTTSSDFGAFLNDSMLFDVPLFSVGNFTGLGDVIAFKTGGGWGSTSSKAIIGDPSSGCVTVMEQVAGSNFSMMWLWNETNPPDPPVWDTIGEKVCVPNTLFGSQVSVASYNLGSVDEYPVFDSNSAWQEWYENKENAFIVSNPTTGTVSLYMYSQVQNEWIVTQEIAPPEGYGLVSFTAEDDSLAISYLPTARATARSFFRSPSDARIDLYDVLYDQGWGDWPTTYQLVSQGANFVGVDVDADYEGHVVTLSQDRKVRAYRRSLYGMDQGTYTQIGEAFEPAKIFNDETVPEDDLTIVKCDFVDVILTASVADTGTQGKKTLGIGNYAYYNYTTDFYCDFECTCEFAGLYPDDCHLLTSEKWIPAYNGAAEFEPNPSEDKPVINFNNKGNSAAVATKSGFMAINTFMAEFPMEFDLQFDASKYASHKVIGISSLGVVSVLVKSTDGTQEIQNWMMAGC